MAKQSRRVNPFYPILVFVGLAFAITACGFALMMIKGINPTGELDAAPDSGFLQFFQEYGFTALMVELAVLALATLGAITTDEMWADRVERPGKVEPTKAPTADTGPPQDRPPSGDA